MRTKIIYATIFSALLLTSFTACGDDNSSNSTGDCTGLAWTQVAQNEFTSVSEAGTEYANNPTVANCELYKDAFREYVDVLEDINASCIPEASEQDYRQAIADAEASIDNIDCSNP